MYLSFTLPMRSPDRPKEFMKTTKTQYNFVLKIVFAIWPIVRLETPQVRRLEQIRVEASPSAEHRVWLWSIGSPLCSKSNERRWVTPAIIPHSLFSVGRFLFQLFENQCYTTRIIILRTDDRTTTSCLLCSSVMLKASLLYHVALFI